MTIDELNALLTAGESERVEWKKAGDVKAVADRVVETLSAFANDHARRLRARLHGRQEVSSREEPGRVSQA